MSEHGPSRPMPGGYPDSPQGRARVEALVALSGAINQLERAVDVAPTDVERDHLQVALDAALRAYRENSRRHAYEMDEWQKLAHAFDIIASTDDAADDGGSLRLVPPPADA